MLTTAKQILRKENPAVKSAIDALEKRVEHMTNQRAQLSLLVKKNQSCTTRIDQNKVYSYFQRPRNYASQFPLNPYRDTWCTRCGHIGHTVYPCWNRPYKDDRMKNANADSEAELRRGVRSAYPCRSDQQPSPGLNKVGVFTVDRRRNIKDLVAATKHTADGASVAKQARIYGTVDMSTLPNPSIGLPFIAQKKASSTVVLKLKQSQRSKKNLRRAR